MKENPQESESSIKFTLSKLLELVGPAIETTLEKNRTIEAKSNEILERGQVCTRDLEILTKEGNTGSFGYMALFNGLPQGVKGKWYNIMKFLSHDIAHLSVQPIRNASYLVCDLWHAETPEDLGKALRVPFEGFWHEYFMQAISKIPALLAQRIYPHQFFRALLEIELGEKPSEIEDVDLEQMLQGISMAMQFRFIDHKYEVVTSEHSDSSKNQIVLDTSGLSISTNPGMIWSVLYNIIKNGIKELCDDEEEPSDNTRDLGEKQSRILNPEAKRKRILVKCQHLDHHNVTLINILDSGEGLSADEIINSLKAILDEQLLDESDLKKSVVKVVNRWKENPFAIRALNMGDVFDMAGLARASGFATRQKVGEMSSGMGLWGVNYLVKEMGGQIIYTNTQQGGAMFTIIIPDDYFNTENSADRRSKRSAVAQLKRDLVRGQVDATIPLAA